MLSLIDRNFEGKYNYFYLPMDLKTRYSVGFAFINMIHPLYILDFYLEFNCFKWSEAIPECFSKKHSQIVYANMQGMGEIKRELKDKNIMKKNDRSIKPILLKTPTPVRQELDEIQYRYTQNKAFVKVVRSKLKEFEDMTPGIE